MARSVHLLLTGESENLLNDLEKIGIDERGVISKGLWLLKIAHETGRLALLKPEHQVLIPTNVIVDQIFCLYSSNIEQEIKDVFRAFSPQDEGKNRKITMKEEE